MHLSYLIVLLPTLVLFRLLLPAFRSTVSPLRSTPGPLWARLTRLWYFFQLRSGAFQWTNIALHRKYGPVVRVMPDHFSLNDPAAIKAIYGINSKFPKSDWYEGWKHPDPDRWTLFPDRNIERHAKTRRAFQNIYSMSSLVSYESYVDNCTGLLVQHLTRFAQSRQVIDMGHWFQCYAFDVIGEITYSRRFGFLDAGEDVEGAMSALHTNMAYSSLSGIFASWYPYHYKLLEKTKGSGAAGRTFMMTFARRQIAKRKEDLDEGKLKLKASDIETGTQEDNETPSDDAPKDFLTKLIEAREANPEKVTEYHLFMMSLSNLIAGSDTTAVSLSGILYHLLQNPETLQKLRAEIDEHDANNKLGKDYIKFKEAQDMSYFQAVMKEGMRLHSAVGLPLWRVVPEGGAELAGRYFPAGTVVGINPWVAHYDEDVFGPDAVSFRPERWIEAEKEGGNKLKEMEDYYFPVSTVTYTCAIGSSPFVSLD